MILQPKNVVSKVGEESKFVCSVDSTDRLIKWYYATLPTDDPQPMFAGEYVANKSLSTRYTVNTFNDHSELRITDTQTSDAGTYICKETGKSDLSSSELVVLGKI